MDPQAIMAFLQPLLGLQLTVARRVADLNNFQFGPLRPVEGGTIGTFALHIQCPWRIEGPSGIVTGRSDLWEPANELPEGAADGWDYDTDANVQDAQLATLLQGSDPATRSTIKWTDQLVVEAIHADAVGGLILDLLGGFRLVVFPAGSRGEHWRAFQPGSAHPHLVSEAHAVSLHP